MAVEIRIPTALRAYTDSAAKVSVEGNTVAAVLGELVERHGDLKRHLRDDRGRLRSFVNIYLNDEDIRYLGGPETELSDGDAVSILPALAGG